MNRLELNTDDETLREILGNGRKYYVPKFQRDYSWEQEHWEILWEDIQALQDGSEPYHYMGYLVIQPPPKSDKTSSASKVIDGQQRLTTFSLIILAVIKRLKEMENEQERIDELFKNFIGNKDLQHLRVENKLKLNRNNDYYFKEAVEGRDIPKRGRKKTIHLMGKAIEYFYNQLKKYNSGEELGKLVQDISEQLLFTSIYIGDELNAYKVFETLNARGVQLSSSDLLKNYIFSLMDKNNDTPEDILDELEEKWEKIGTNIGNTNYSDYILTEWNGRNKLTRKSNLFKNIKNKIKDKQSSKNYLIELERKSDCYAALLDYNNDFWKDHQEYIQIKNSLECLQLFNIKQPISMLLACYDKSPNDFVKLLKWIKVFSIRYNVIGREHTGEQENLYNQISLMIQDNCTMEAIKERLLALYPTDEKFKQAFSEKTMPTEQSNKKARYLLARLDEKENKDKSSIDEINLTVEHILPLNPNEQWIDNFGENWKMYNLRIGNMALVSTDTNKNLGQKSFTEKQKILQDTQYNINNIDQYHEWTYQAIETRQKQMSEVAVSLWRID